MDLKLIFGIVFLLFVMQSVGGYFQIKNYRHSVRRVSGHGCIGIGQKRGKFFSGYLTIIACDTAGIITYCEVMDGVTFLSRFHEKNCLMGEKMIGQSIEYFMNKFRSMDSRDAKKYKGYVQAIDALCKHLHPELYKKEEMGEIMLNPQIESN